MPENFGPEFHRSTRIPKIDGFWTWDVKHDRVYGDANLFYYFGIPAEDISAGAPIERFMNGIVETDRHRVERALREATVLTSAFRQIYSVASMGGVRKIMAVGRCYPDTNGNPHLFPGWFMDVSTPTHLRGNTLKLASVYVEHAKDLAISAGVDLVAYLLDNVAEEIDALVEGRGDRKSRFKRS